MSKENYYKKQKIPPMKVHTLFVRYVYVAQMLESDPGRDILSNLIFQWTKQCVTSLGEKNVSMVPLNPSLDRSIANNPAGLCSVSANK